VKSEPEPSASIRRPERSRAFCAVLGFAASEICFRRARASTLIFFCGSSTSAAEAETSGSSACEPPASKKPRSLPSVLM
jgi:hypothetical protein